MTIRIIGLGSGRMNLEAVVHRLCLLTLGLLGVFPAGVSGQNVDAELVARLDSAARAHVESAIIPGVSVTVVRGGQTILQRGYGFVDLEWNTPTPRDGGASYEIGSMTKQFTAAAVLLLAEEGLLDLDADLRDYVDFDTQGRLVTVRRLLDHTSGIRSYTEMEAFGEFMVHDLPRDSLLRAIEDVPFDFEPGTALIYNNSAYFLLGLIIEEVAGTSYEDFVQERLFAAAGMDESYYCSESLVRAERAHGYDAVGPDRVIRARYLDHTWPYAAGSLCSTVGDLAEWNRALHGGEILTAGSYRALTTPHPLEDGTSIRYAMGLSVTDRGGHRQIAHGGGINGFLSDGRYYPDEDLVVVVLQNSTGPVGPGALSSALVDLVLGEAAVPASDRFSGDLADLVGEYSGPARGVPMTLRVTADDGEMAVSVNGADPATPRYSGELTWALGGTHLIFEREDGRVVRARFDAPSAHYVLTRR